MSLNASRITSGSFIPVPDPNLIDPRGIPIHSLYEYRNITRHLILGAKMLGDWQCLDFIRREFRRLIGYRREFSHIEVVVAAPSSLWGRIRLRVNIAQQLAMDFSKIYQIPIFELPLSASLKLRKRARSDSKRWIADEICRPEKVFSPKFQQVKGMHVLLIDDIVTSGLTLASIGMQFSESKVQFMSFASALSRPN